MWKAWAFKHSKTTTVQDMFLHSIYHQRAGKTNLFHMRGGRLYAGNTLCTFKLKHIIKCTIPFNIIIIYHHHTIHLSHFMRNKSFHWPQNFINSKSPWMKLIKVTHYMAVQEWGALSRIVLRLVRVGWLRILGPLDHKLDPTANIDKYHLAQHQYQNVGGR